MALSISPSTTGIKPVVRLVQPTTLGALAPRTPSPDSPTPAMWTILGKRHKKGKDEHLAAAELVTRLESLRYMYKHLVAKEVGTNVVEAEVSRMVKECVSGPTGHRLLEVEGTDRVVIEKDGSETVIGGLKCWRDVGLVRKMTMIRLKVVEKQLKKARLAMRDEMRFVTVTRTKGEVRKAWKVRLVKKEMWDQEHARIQRKVAHLCRRAKDCRRLKACRELDRMWEAGKQGQGQ